MSPEWVAAIATVLVALGTACAAIAERKAVTARRKAPLDAAHMAASLQEAGEKRRLKLSVFSTVMQNRHFLASRLGFDCSPKGKFLGLDVNGKRVPFDKNVFYEYQTKKIWRVWSVIDKAAIEAQLYGETLSR
jgi:hypothetical protein